MSFSVKIEPNDEDKSDNEQEPELVIDDEQELNQKEMKVELKEGKIPIAERPVVPQPQIVTPPTVSDLYSAIASAPRRCETCDIKFTYLKSYLAHKEFYCKERNNNGTNVAGSVTGKSSADGMTSPSPSSNGLTSAVTNSRAAEVQ